MKSWRTTFIGGIILIVLVGKIVQDIKEGNPIEVGELIQTAAIAALGFFARDNIVTSEEAKGL